jgi:hypothetical protein
LDRCAPGINLLFGVPHGYSSKEVKSAKPDRVACVLKMIA